MFKKLPHDELLRSLNLPTLERRRVRGDLIQFFKIVNKFETVELCNLPIFKSHSITRGHAQKYSREICK